MKRFTEQNGTFLGLLLVIVVAFTVLPGCAQLQGKLNQDVDQALALALPDLDAAHARAVAAHDPNPAHDLCWTGLADGIRAQQAADQATAAATGPVTGPAGLADGAEAFLLDDVKPLTLNLPPLAPGVKSACYATIGELRVKAKFDLANAITATVRKLKIGG